MILVESQGVREYEFYIISELGRRIILFAFDVFLLKDEKGVKIARKCGPEWRLGIAASEFLCSILAIPSSMARP